MASHPQLSYQLTRAIEHMPYEHCPECRSDSHPCFPMISTENGVLCLFHAPSSALVEQGWSQERISGIVAETDWKSASGALRGTVVNCDLLFDNIELADIDFSDVRFLGKVEFKKCRVPGPFLIFDCKFDHEVRFNNCVFADEFHFERNSVSGNIYFHDCVLKDDAHFSESKFAGPSVFSHNEFLRYFSLRSSVFWDYFWSTDNIHEGYVSLLQTNFHREAFFESCRFYRVNTFDRAKFSRTVSFDRTQFDHAPTFFDTTFLELLTIEGSVFSDLTSPDAYNSYRLIREIFAGQSMRRSQATFYFLEQSALTRMQPNRMEKIIGYAYEWFSGYGTKLRRSLYCLLAVNAIFLAFYSITTSSVDTGARIFFQQLFRPFSIWDSRYISQYPCLDSIWHSIAASVHAISSLVLLTFFLFSLRWRFKNS